VKQYTNNEIRQLDASTLGLVEASYCQKDFKDAKPNKRYLISLLKVKTQRLGGNGVVFDSCALRTVSAVCHTHMKCQGIAYQISH
jgi:hypothetical protein